jgi:GT2 family glycosyltransferase
MKFSVIIPTYQRLKELEACLNSLLRQDLLPKEIIIIDDAELSEEFVKYWQKEAAVYQVSFVYYKKNQAAEARGSSTSRNIGLEKASEKICFILDDDLDLENYFFSKIMADWNNDEKLIGVGGVIINNRKKTIWEKRYNKFFGLSAELSWDINNNGFQSWDDGIEDRQIAYYVHGGVCAYNKDVVKALGGFTIFSGGREALEDLDFCWRAKKAGYYFFIEPAARVFHAHSPSGREDNFTAGFKEGANRKKIFVGLGGQEFLDKLSFYWANLGWILRSLAKRKFKKAQGMLKGLFLNK